MVLVAIAGVGISNLERWTEPMRSTSVSKTRKNRRMYFHLLAWSKPPMTKTSLHRKIATKRKYSANPCRFTRASSEYMNSMGNVYPWYCKRRRIASAVSYLPQKGRLQLVLPACRTVIRLQTYARNRRTTTGTHLLRRRSCDFVWGGKLT
jgi:hypothetical protein